MLLLDIKAPPSDSRGATVPRPLRGRYGLTIRHKCQASPTGEGFWVKRLETVGVIGCGRMGAEMAKHLLAAGWELVVADPDASAREALTALGAKAASTAAQVAERAELSLVVVVDDDQVSEVVAGEDGVLAGTSPGDVVAICASVRPDTCRVLAE